MEIIVAKSAGFCFGVTNAVNKAFDTIDNNKESTIYTLGELIHNPQIINKLEEQGILPIEDTSSIDKGCKIIIRAHGVPKIIYDEINNKGIEIVDATCPYVKRIHNLVNEKSKEGYDIIIVGDKNHPEVKGIMGWIDGKNYVINSSEEANRLIIDSSKTCIVAQTTINEKKWQDICTILNKKFANILKFDTICSATSNRQKEADEISKTVDMMVVIGGKNSSNTQKLFEICKMNCPNTLMIQSALDLLPLDKNSMVKKIGITAGASTPEWVIEEVILKMEEMISMKDNEMSFKDAFEESLVTLRSGEVVKGRVIGYNNSEVFVDLGYKSDGIISMEEFLDNPDFDPEKDLLQGNEIEVYIVRVNDGEGNVQLSKKKVDAIRGIEKIEEAFNNNTVLEAKIKEAVKGGVTAELYGLRVFIPASQVSDRYVKELKDFVGKKVRFEITEFQKAKKKIVGSCRKILEKERAEKLEKFWYEVEIGKEYEGKVKSITDFGAFVDLGAIDGLVHINELSWNKINHPKEV